MATGPIKLDNITAPVDQSRDSAVVFSNLTVDGLFPTREVFMNFLSEWETSISTQFLWTVTFQVPPIVSDEAMKTWGELWTDQSWNVNSIRNTLHTRSLTESYGCLFAQSVILPGENMDYGNISPGNRSFQHIPFLRARNQPEVLTLRFQETNASFTDFLLRPWAILAGHYGLTARSLAENIKADVIVTLYAKAGGRIIETSNGQDVNINSFVPRKVWMFHDCVPVSIGNTDYTYDTTASPELINTVWVYSRYQVHFPEVSLKQVEENNKFNSFQLPIPTKYTPSNPSERYDTMRTGTIKENDRVRPRKASIF